MTHSNINKYLEELCICGSYLEMFQQKNVYNIIFYIYPHKILPYDVENLITKNISSLNKKIGLCEIYSPDTIKLCECDKKKCKYCLYKDNPSHYFEYDGTIYIISQNVTDVIDLLKNDIPQLEEIHNEKMIECIEEKYKSKKIINNLTYTEYIKYFNDITTYEEYIRHYEKLRKDLINDKKNKNKVCEFEENLLSKINELIDDFKIVIHTIRKKSLKLNI